MTAFLYFLNVVCSAGQSTISKYYASKGVSSTVFSINKLVTGFLVFLAVGLWSGIRFHSPTVLLGIAYGVTVYVSNFSGFTALSLGPMAPTSIIAAFSMVIPFIVGVTVWGEELSVYGALGILLLVSSIVLINFQKSEERISPKWMFFTLLTFFSNGVASLIQKQHQINYPGCFRTEFMLCGILCALALFTVSVLAKKQEEAKVQFCLPGNAAGFIEAIASYIVLYLAATQNASVLFPVVSVAKIISVWCIGRIAFKEKMKAVQALGLAAGILAILLLNM